MNERGSAESDTLFAGASVEKHRHEERLSREQSFAGPQERSEEPRVLLGTVPEDGLHFDALLHLHHPPASATAASWASSSTSTYCMASPPQQVRVDPELTVLVKMRTTRETAFTTHGFGIALGALAWLARNEENRDPVRTLLDANLTHPNDAIRLATIDTLGLLDDPKALAKIEPFTRTTQDSPVRRAALSAVNALRAGRRPAADLRDEALSLRQENRELKSGLDDLKKQFEERHRPEAQ